jgi:hypothetical protein
MTRKRGAGSGWTAAGAGTHRIGSISERFESGGRGPGTVSSGAGDPGGVSYGTYQLASRTGTLGRFLEKEGARWAAELAAGGKPGSAGFSAVWKAIALREREAFATAQHSFIARTHYAPAVDKLRAGKAIDLDTRHDAVREAVWSVSVQHRRAADILMRAVDAARLGGREAGADFDRRLVDAIYDARSAYVRRVANAPRLKPAEAAQLRSIVANRYPAERKAVMALFAASITK